ncbi:MAG: methyltransferase domain-containing protein [Candidatus Omnitrophica bacterium]|nr:methyltransferase domain-containing protein [Candidatus Omnitrophota bacterium]
MTFWKVSSLTERVRRAFSEAADQYDILAGLHREIGRDLMGKIVRLPQARYILDVGCGTGYLTGKANFYFPESHVIGLDFSEEMLAKAKEKHENISWITADAHHLPLKDKAMDIIVSNLAYQWVLDLPKAFVEARRVLSPEGVLAATLFGYQTCDELFSSLQAVGVSSQDFHRLPTMDEIQRSLVQAGFAKTDVDYERIQIQFKDLWDLLGWLKAIGANGLSHGEFLGPQTLEEANAYCLNTYPYHDGIRVTFEVIWIYANA